MLIRRATPDDVPAIRALEQQAETAAHWKEREYGALFAAEAPPRIALVATEADTGSVISFVIARCATGEWEIENVVVAPEQRKRGIGIKIIRELVLRAKHAGATSVLLEVRESNLAARRLYEKVGFSYQGQRSGYYQHPQEYALLLRFPLQICDKIP
ncbi:MAG: ribosomal protein S18-alanine N-acetyltransferase [Candidatus Korobacteraceae bacterium]